MLISEIVRTKVITLSEKDTIAKAISTLAEHEISGAPVVDESNSVVGILNEVDILRAMRTVYKELKMVYPSIPVMGISFVEIHRRKEVFKALREINERHVSDFMEKDIHTVKSSSLVEDIIPLMAKDKADMLPVVSDKGELIGIVTRGDVLNVLVTGT